MDKWLDPQKVIQELNLRFTSGNEVPVERVYIRRDEWTALVHHIVRAEYFAALHTGRLVIVEPQT